METTKARRRERTSHRVLALIVLLGLVACRKEEPAAPPELRVNVALGSAPVSLDPHYTNESVSYAINSNIYETLVRNDTDLNLVPSLATGWTNPDDLTWEFALDRKARFHNGAPCTSADVAFSLERVRSDPRSDWKASLVAVDRIEAPASDRVIIRTRTAFPALLRYLAALAIVPKDARDLDTNPIGTGPYRFVSIDRARGIVELRRWADYRGAEPEVDSGSFRWIEDHHKRQEALRNGAVDLITDVPPENMADLRKYPEVVTHQVPSLRMLFLSFDVQRRNSPYVSLNPNPFQDVRVRRACGLALDRARIVREVFRGYGREATQVVAPSVFGFNPEVKAPAFSVDEARRLMKEAGYAQGFSVTLDAPENAYPGDARIADLVARSLKEIGIEVRVNKMQKEALFGKLTARDTSFYMISWNCLSADAQEVFTYLLHTPEPSHGYGPDNYGGYSNADLDRIVEQASQQMDSAKRLELWRRAIAVVMTDSPWAPLTIQTHLYAMRSSLEWKPRQDRVILFSEIRKKQDP